VLPEPVSAFTGPGSANEAPATPALRPGAPSAAVSRRRQLLNDDLPILCYSQKAAIVLPLARCCASRSRHSAYRCAVLNTTRDGFMRSPRCQARADCAGKRRRFI
jgi:hypothetical protein